MKKCEACGVELDGQGECWWCGGDYQPHSCGYPEGTFACRIRHIQINTGAAKAAND